MSDVEIFTWKLRRPVFDIKKASIRYVPCEDTYYCIFIDGERFLRKNPEILTIDGKTVVRGGQNMTQEAMQEEWVAKGYEPR